MQYRRFGGLDFKVSALGFGAMRLPTVDGAIETQEATEMLHYAIDHGVNYVDTAYPYHLGGSETFLGQALKGGYREKVKLATKLPSWEVNTYDDFDRFLGIQLERLQVDTVDFYLLHGLNKKRWPKLRDLGVLEWAEGAIAAGRFHHLAFSFHDDFDTFKQIVDGYDKWAMSQIQYNYMDVENQAGVKGLKYAASKGLAVVIMEPLLGGKLVDPPPPIQALWDGAAEERTPVAWALRWLWDQPEVSTVLSGVSAMAHVKENVALAAASGTGILAEEFALYDQVRSKYQELTAISCTGCGYCMPCPQGVNIPANFNDYNEGLMFDKPEVLRGHYAWWKFAYEEQGIFDHDVRAACCIQCGECESKCPQGIPISQWMPVIHQVLGENAPYVTELA